MEQENFKAQLALKNALINALKIESVDRQRQHASMLNTLLAGLEDAKKNPDKIDELIAHVKGLKMMGWDTALSNQHIETTEASEAVVTSVALPEPEPVTDSVAVVEVAETEAAPKAETPAPPPAPKPKKEKSSDESTEHTSSEAGS